ncbi:MAG: SH3 domain-containing protein, partial [Phycisphaerae bacterium]|nr:SH3 domain-containing protein [Saprospiraceae bacterium]
MRYSLPILFLVFSFCKKGQTPEPQLFVHAAQTSLRAEPSEKSREIATLQKGQALTDLGEVGPSETQIAVGEELFQTPWIKVQTVEDQSGWVLAWAVRPAKETKDWLLQKRLVCYFGEALASRRNTLCETFPHLKMEGQLAESWRDATALRDTFLQMLSRRPESGFQPNFNWLNDALPGFLYQRSGESGRPYLFADFAAWQQKALKTNGLQDDVFFESCFVAFSRDS